jgi:hypothetical protein
MSKLAVTERVTSKLNPSKFSLVSRIPANGKQSKVDQGEERKGLEIRAIFFTIGNRVKI